MPRKIVLFELNEVPWRIYDEYCAWRPQSVLAGLIGRCRQYTTRAPDRGVLSPWFTWPTFHRGVSNEQHGIAHFGQDLSQVDERFPPVWSLLTRSGIRCGVFGPLHSYPLPADVDRYAFFVPDTFAASPECHPDSLTAFQRFNLAMARESPRNVSTDINWRAGAEFLVRAPVLGLRPSTVAHLARQLLDERRDGWKRVRRRTFQSVLAFDLFERQLARSQPDFANCFTNHVASAMHRYWAATFPDDYDHLDFGPDWISRYSTEIRFAMDWSDRFFSRLVRFVDRHPEYLLVVASSMGQKAHRGEAVKTQLYLRHPELLMRMAGIADTEWQRRPAMEPKVSLLVAPERRESLLRFLRELAIDGQPPQFHEKESGFFSLGFGQKNLHEKPQVARVAGREVPFAELGLECVGIEDEADSTGYHIPQGSLAIYDPQKPFDERGRPDVLSTDFAPSLLAHFGIPVPSYMRAPGAIRFD